MRVIIIEDEIPAANRLTRMLQGIDGEIERVHESKESEGQLEAMPKPDERHVYGEAEDQARVAPLAHGHA